MADKIMLIDGHSLVYKAYYALPALKNKKGDYTNAIYGFLNTVIRFIEEENPDYLAVAFDLSTPTFRHEKFPDYKGTRKPMPEEMRPQIPVLKELLQNMNIPIYEIEGYEADDILGSLANISEKEGKDVVIISGDRDLLQIATDKTQIRIPTTKQGQADVENYYAKDVEKAYGLTPTEFIDMKALMGDTSDNVPGVPSIGEVTSKKIISEYKTVENAIKNADKVKPKRASENLVKYEEQALLSKKLVTIHKDIPLETPKDKITKEIVFNDTVLKEMENLEFRSLLQRFDDREENTEKSLKKVDYKLIDNKDMDNLIKAMKEAEISAFDFIIDDALIYGFSFYSNDTGYFLEFNEDSTLEDFLKLSKSYFENDSKKITMDSKKCRTLLWKNNMEINNIIFDTSLAGYILDSTSSNYDYERLADKYLDEKYPSLEELVGKGVKKLAIKDLDEEAKILYNCRQSHIPFDLYPVMDKELEDNNQNQLYYDIELPTSIVLASMEIEGIKVNREALMELDTMLEGNLEILTKDIYEDAGEEFNINSPAQLGIILFEKLGLTGGRKTKTGYSTAADILDKVKFQHPIVEKVLEYRTLAKLKSTYADGLLKVRDKDTGKIYSTFNQTVTATGRISSTEPNLQNIPIRTEIGRQFRKVFVPSSEDYVFIDGDYSQIELRVLAHISKDPTMIDAFINNADIHRITASQVLHKNPEDISERERDSAKAVNFGIVYGISAYSLSEDLGIPIKEAEEYINGYFTKYPKVKEYMDDAIKFTKDTGFAITLFGRRRNVPEIKSPNYNIRSFGERVAMNMPIQGTAADIMKIDMVKVYERLNKENLKSKIILQVHDELLIEAHKDEVDLVNEILKEEMESSARLLVPLKVDVNTGNTWFEV